MTIKILFHNMMSYKKKMIPIVVSVSICITMVLACFMYVDISKQKNCEKYDGVYQKLDLVMYFPDGVTEQADSLIKNSGYNQVSWFADTESAVRSGNDINNYMLQMIDYDSYSKLKTVSQFENEGDGILIKDYVANKNSLSVGDNVEIYINGKFYKLKVLGITVSGDMTTNFYGDILVTKSTLKKHDIDINGMENNAVGIDFGRNSDKADLLINAQELKSAKYTDYISMYENDVKEDSYFLLAMYSILAIGIICVFGIVNSSFHQMALARTSDIIMLKSLGISRRQESGYWYIQSLILSLASFVIGMIVGLAAVNVAFIFIFQIKSIVLPSALCVIIAFLVTFVPNLYITAQIVREMTQANISTLLKQTAGNTEIDETKPLTIFITVIIMAVCVVADKLLLRYWLTNKWLYIGLCIFDIVLFSIILCYLAAFVISTAVSSKKFILIKSLHVGGKQIKNMVISVILSIMLFVGLFGVFGNVRDTFINSMKATFSYSYQISGTFSDKDVDNLKSVFKDNGITDFMFQNVEDAIINDMDLTSTAVAPDKMSDVYSFTYSDGKKSMSAKTVTDKMKFSSSNILISDRFSKKAGINVGDKVTMEISGIKKEYIVIGTCNHAGNQVFIHDSGQYNQLIVKKSDLPMQKMKDILNENSKSDYNIISMDELCASESEHINRNLSTFSTLSLIIVFIAALILLNTLFMSINEHKRDIAVLNTLGIKRRKLFVTLFSRVVIYILASAAGGFATALEFTYMSSGMMSKILYFEINRSLQIAESLKYTAFIILALLASSIITIAFALRENKESLISYVKE